MCIRDRPDTEQVSLYEQQSLRLDSIKVEAKNEHDVDWYGFNPRRSGEWTVVDEGLNDASEYAEAVSYTHLDEYKRQI